MSTDTLPPHEHRQAVVPPPGDATELPAMAQVGWLGHSGKVYGLDEDPTLDERGAYQALYIQVGTWYKRDRRRWHSGWELKD